MLISIKYNLDNEANNEANNEDNNLDDNYIIDDNNITILNLSDDTDLYKDMTKFDLFDQLINIIDYDKVVYIDCHYNKLTSLPELPNSLQQLYCG